MMTSKATPILRSVRVRLLVMLALLSLPLLIVSLLQLENYRRGLREQAEVIARVETASAAAALSSWLETHPSAQIDSPSLYGRLRQGAALDAGVAVAVFDAQGRYIANGSEPGPVPELAAGESTIKRWQWSDGIARVTNQKLVEPFGWSVVVGVPPAASARTGRSSLELAATWLLTLIFSTLLGIWAVGRFTNPLRKLAASASTLGEGNLRERVAVETEDEVGKLAEGFNVMAAHLETKFNEVQTQSAFIEEVLDGLPLGVAVLDASLIVRKANPTFARVVGRNANELAGRGLYEAAAGLAVLSDVVEDVRRTRKPFISYGLQLNFVARHKVGTEKNEAEDVNFWDVTIWPITARSSVRGDLIFILSEVSKRVRAEKLATAAFASERTRAAELESVINQMNEGVVLINTHGRYKVNPAAAQIMGRKRSQFRDGAQALIADFAFRDADGRELALEETPLWRALERREQVSGEQLQIVRLDGEKRVVAVSATPLTNEHGGREGAVAVFRDITEEVRQHDELVAAYDRLREHDRLKSAFVTNITHELRTPLNVILGLCQLLARDPRLPLVPLQGEVVTRMERNARSLLEIVNDLLDYSRLEAGRAALHLERVDLSEVVKEIIDDYAAEARSKRIELRMDVAPDLGRVMTDRHKLSQVLSNLVSNAIKFTSAGAVTVAAKPLDDERWCLEVSDTGIGMSRDALSYIFDEFRQVDDRLARSYGGTGLGLAITRKIVELLEGEILVESELREGSRFYITWPRTIRQRTGTGSLVEKDVPMPVVRVKGQS